MNAKPLSYGRFISYIKANAILDNGEDPNKSHIDRIRLMAVINIDILLIAYPDDIYGYLKKLLKITNDSDIETLRLIVKQAKTKNLQLFHKYLLDGKDISKDVQILKDYAHILKSGNPDILLGICEEYKEKDMILQILSEG